MGNYYGQSYCGVNGPCSVPCEDLTFFIDVDNDPLDLDIGFIYFDTGFGYLLPSWSDSLEASDAGTRKIYTNEICPTDCFAVQVMDSAGDGSFAGNFGLRQETTGFSACWDGTPFDQNGRRLQSLNEPGILVSSGCSESTLMTACPTEAPSETPSDTPSVSVGPTETPSYASEGPTGTPVSSMETPSSAPFELESDDRLECFSGEMEVVVQGRGPVKMEFLEVGDFIKVGGVDTYEQVYAFAHHVPQMHTEFLQFHTNAGAPLEMTAGHLVFVNGNKNPIRADSIKVGDLLEAESNETIVEKITLVSRNGIYNPLTQSGTIQVNGIIASTYISFEKGNNEYIDLEGSIPLLLSHHHFAHSAITPFRFYCTALALCEEGNNGLPIYVSKGMDVIEWSKEQHILLQILMWASFRMLLLASILIMSTITMIPASLISGITILHLQQILSLTVMAVDKPNIEMKEEN